MNVRLNDIHLQIDDSLKLEIDKDNGEIYVKVSPVTQSQETQVREPKSENSLMEFVKELQKEREKERRKAKSAPPWDSLPMWYQDHWAATSNDQWKIPARPALPHFVTGLTAYNTAPVTPLESTT